MATTVRVPLQASYKIIDGVPVLQSAEYADVDVDIIARLLLDAFRVQAEKKDG